MESTLIKLYRRFILLTCLTAVSSLSNRRPSEVAIRENLKKLATANNYFALNLHRQLTSGAENENVFFSPLSLSFAFGMLLYGAKGDTSKELRNALGFQTAGLSNELVHRTLNSFILATELNSSSKGYTMDIANGILVSKQLPLLLDYQKAVMMLYKAPIENADFVGQSSIVKDSVNNWVNKQTKGKITRLMDDLSPDTIMIILNAVYFKGLWKTPFDSYSTSDEKFYNNGQESQVKRVPTMHMAETKFPFAFTESYQVLELPYEGNVSMMVLLPTERNGLPALEASLTPDLLKTIRGSMRPTKVTITLPKFKIEYSKNLYRELQALGMRKVFRAPDLSGISRARGLRLSEVVHKAFVSVDELGTEAAAATGLSLTPYSGSMSEQWFFADHPFLFTIFDKASGMILFMGRVNNL